MVEHEEDLYYATFDGTAAVRLTSQPGREQLAQFSPDGKHVAFVRDFDLVRSSTSPTQTERRLTTGGRETCATGMPTGSTTRRSSTGDWPAFWWSPDSKRLAFMEFDDAAVGVHTLVDAGAAPSAGSSRRITRAPASRTPRSGWASSGGGGRGAVGRPVGLSRRTRP